MNIDCTARRDAVGHMTGQGARRYIERLTLEEKYMLNEVLKRLEAAKEAVGVVDCATPCHSKATTDAQSTGRTKHKHMSKPLNEAQSMPKRVLKLVREVLRLEQDNQKQLKSMLHSTVQGVPATDESIWGMLDNAIAHSIDNSERVAEIVIELIDKFRSVLVSDEDTWWILGVLGKLSVRGRHAQDTILDMIDDAETPRQLHAFIERRIHEQEALCAFAEEFLNRLIQDKQ